MRLDFAGPQGDARQRKGEPGFFLDQWPRERS
jgi:hypothetical protein